MLIVMMMMIMLKASHSVTSRNVAGKDDWDQRRDFFCFTMIHHLLNPEGKEYITGGGHGEMCACACGQLK